MQRLQQSSFKHKTAKACTPKQYMVCPSTKGGTLKSGGAQ